jgi:hypothetical protein
MSFPERTIGPRALLETYLESLRPQVHQVLIDHNQRTLAAFEAALQVRVPRDVDDVPDQWRPLFMLFRSTVDSLLGLRTPTSGSLEAGLIFTRLDDAGTAGVEIHENLRRIADAASAMEDAELAILEVLLRIFLGHNPPTLGMDVVRATGIYPGDAPKDFDVFDHM